MFRIVLVLVTVLGSFALCAAAPLEPQIPAAEHVAYQRMLKTNRTAAQQYLDTRNYLSLCRQVIASPSRARDLVPEPDTYRPQYVTSGEQKIVDQAIRMNIAAMLSRKH